MYVHPAFKTDEDTAWSFVEARGFGAVVSVDKGSPVASHIPLLVERDGSGVRLQFHVARVNPLHEIIARTPQVLVIVSGPDAYISPDWYVSADQVPTWNYVSVHVTGTARALALDAALAHVEAMSLKFEQWLAPKKPWSTSKMPPRKLEAMLRAIVPIEVTVDGIEASWKLGQHKTLADQYEVARMLEWRGDWNGRAMAEIMKQRFSESARGAQKPSEAA
jgi:transcriptional regulator